MHDENDKDYFALHKIYGDIVRGFSPFVFNGEQLFIKHFSSFDYAEIDNVYNQCFDKVASQGVMTERQLLDLAKSNGSWTNKDDIDTSILSESLKNLQVTKSKTLLSKDIKALEQEIEKTSNKLSEILQKKKIITQHSAEHLAYKRVNEQQIVNAIFTDSNLSCRLFNDDGDDTDYLPIVEIYNNITNKISTWAIKRIALRPFFRNVYYLSEDNPMTFYGKPLCLLSMFQVELLAFGKYFKHILTNSDLSEEQFYSDPDKLIDAYNTSKNLKSIKEKQGNNVNLVGASKEDLERLGSDGGKPTEWMNALISSGKKEMNLSSLVKK